MSTVARAQVKPILQRSSTPVQTQLLQRTCACGGTLGVDGGCAECRSKRLSSQRQVTPMSLQTKLTVNQPGDRYELEAERVAEHVMRMPNTVSLHSGELKRKTPEYNEELHRQPTDEEEDEKILQAKEVPGKTPLVTPELQTRVNSLRGKGQSLPEATRAFMEPRFGHDFSKVRIHADSQAAESAHAVNALAYTMGTDIVFGAGQYQSGTSAGQRLLAHELTHVVQQTGNQEIQVQRKEDEPASQPETEWQKKLNQILPGGVGPLAAIDRFLTLLEVFNEAALSDLVNKIYDDKAARNLVHEYGVPGIVALCDTLTNGLDVAKAREALSTKPGLYNRAALKQRPQKTTCGEAIALPRLEISLKLPKTKPHLLLPGEQLSLQSTLPQIEWEARPKIQTRYKTWQEYERVRNQVAGWTDPVVRDPDGFIEEAIDDWNANPKIHGYIGENGNNFDGNPHRSYLNLKRLFQQRGIANIAGYFADKIIDITFFNVHTQGHRSLAAKLDNAQRALIAAGHHYVFDVASNVPHGEPASFAFVPRTQNQSINRLSNHALGTAIDLNPRSNPQILSNMAEVTVINAVCGPVLPHGFLATTDYPTLKRASDYFKAHFNAAWVAQQKQLLNQMQHQHPQPPGLAAQQQLVAAINARRDALDGYATDGFLNLTQELVTELRRAHLQWGGEYTTSKDFMHFEDLNP